MAIRTTDWNLGITVEGLGDASAAHDDKMWRFSRLQQEAATGGADLHVPVLGEYPSTFAAEVDFRGGRSSLGGFAVELQAQGEDSSGVDVATRMYRSRYRPIGFVGVALTSSTATITINDASGSAITTLSLPLGIALERECLVLDSHSGSGVYVCQRGQFGTIAVAHAIGETDDTAIFESEHWHIPADREVTLFRTQTNRDQTNEEVITRGVVRGVSAPPGRIRLDCSGPLELLQLRQLCSRMLQGNVALKSPVSLTLNSDLEGNTEPNYALAAAFNDAISANNHRALFMIDDKHAVLNDWVELTTLHQPKIIVFRAAGVPEAANQSRQFAGSPPLLDLEAVAGKRWNEFFSLHPTAPALTTGGAKLGAATVNGNAITGSLFVCLLQCLLTTPDGSNHATYDLGSATSPRIYDNLGFGVNASLVDVRGIEDLAIELADVGQMPLLHLGLDGKAFDGLDFFQSALKVLGCVLTQGSEGKLSVVRFRDTARLSTPAIPQADVIGMPVQRKRVEDTFDSLTVEYADIPGVGTVKDTFDDVIKKRRLISGRHRSSTLNARGIEDRDLFRGPIIARHVQRYHYPIPELTFTTLRSQSHWPGDVVTLTHDKVYGASSRGITAGVLLITGRSEDIKDGTINYRSLQVGVAYAKTGLIAPAAQVQSFDGGTDTITFNNSVYTSVVGAGDDLTSDTGDTTWPVGAEVMILTAALAVRDAGPFEVTASSGSTVTLDSTPTGIVANDVLVPAKWDDADATQKAKWSWIADGSLGLGAAPDIAYEWTL
jgi:hypothetical protein